LIERRRGSDPFERLGPVVSQADLIAAQNAISRVKIAGEVIDYLHAIVLATRSAPTLAIGASTRAALFLERATCAFATVQARSYATPDDVKAVAIAVLAHRVRVSGKRDQYATHGDAERAIGELLDYVAVPV
jgi:MoxR-like ATPase